MVNDPFDPDTPPVNGGGAPKGIPESDIADSVGRVSAAARQNRQQAEDDTFITAGVAAAFGDFDALFEERKVAATQGPAGFAETFSQDLRDAVPALVDRLRAEGHRPSEAGIDGLAQRLEMIRGQFGTRAITHENNTRVMAMTANLDRTLEGLAARALADPDRFDALMVSAGDALQRAGSHLDPAAVESRRPALEAIAEAAVLGRIGEDPLGAINDLEIGFFDQDLPGPAQKKLMRRAEAALRDQEAAAELARANEAAAARAEASRRLIALEGAIGRGEAGEQDIDAAADILNDNTHARLSTLLETRKTEDATRGRRIATVSALLDGEETDRLEEGGDGTDVLRPGSPEWPSAVNEHYATLAPTLDGLDPDERTRFDEDYAKKTGVLPDPVANRLRAGLLSADPGEQVEAAERLVRFRDIDPALLAAIPEDERARAEAIHGFAALGLPNERAVELTDRKLEEEKRAAANTPGTNRESPTSDNPKTPQIIGPGGEGHPTEEPLPPTPEQEKEIEKNLRFTPEGVLKFFDETAKLDDKEFGDAATAAGMDPERAALARLISRATDEDRETVSQRIDRLSVTFKSDFEKLLKDTLEVGDDLAARRQIFSQIGALLDANIPGGPQSVAESLAIFGPAGIRGKIPTGKKRVGGGVPKPAVTVRVLRDFSNESSFGQRQIKGMSQQALKDADGLVTKFRQGIESPGFGSGRIRGEPGFIELRGRNLGRVLVKQTGKNGEWDIVGRFQAHKKGDKENSKIIKKLIKIYKDTTKGKKQ